MHDESRHPATEENQLVQIRKEKLQQLRAQGLDPFAVERFPITHTLQQVHDGYATLQGQTVAVAGRITAIRKMGKATFAHLMDSTGKLQIYLKADEQGERYELIDLWDLGDYLGVEGFVFQTRTGEITVHVQQFTLLAKAVRPVPFPKEKGEQRWYELHDVEQRYRQRYLDLLVNPDSRERLLARCAMIREIRRFLDARGFLEVETPILQPLAGGAAARPFITHHNALDREFQLRIALELHLKRLLIGGIDRVYEIGRVFRNEGISTRHNPEFTMLELYQAYANLEDIMALVEELFHHVAEQVFGRTVFEMHGVQVDFSQPWRRVRLMDAIREHTGLTEADFETLERAVQAAEKLGIHVERKDTVGGIIEKVLESASREHFGPAAADLHIRLPAGHLAAGEARTRQPALHTPLRRLHLRQGSRQRLLGAERPAGAARPLRAATRVASGRRRGGAPVRRGLPAGDGVRHAPRRRAGDWD
jgi:lysyl-tRNA synthetase class 2